MGGGFQRAHTVDSALGHSAQCATSCRPRTQRPAQQRPVAGGVLACAGSLVRHSGRGRRGARHGAAMQPR